MCKTSSCQSVTSGRSRLFWFSNEQVLQVVINEAALCNDWCQKTLFSVLGCHAGDLSVRALSAEGTADMPLVSLRCSGDKCGPCILYSRGYLSPGLSIFALLTDINSVMQTRPRKSSVYHGDRSQLCISWSTSTEGEPLPETLTHCWLVQRVIYHGKAGVAPLFLCTQLFLKPAPVSGTHSQPCALLLQNTQPDIELISSVHEKFLSEPEFSDLFLAWILFSI